MTDRSPTEDPTRRRFLTTAGAALGFGAAGLLAPRRGLCAGEGDEPALAFGVVTDVHYADAPPRGSRHYRDSLAKLRAAVDTFSRRKVAFAVELGDLIDSGPSKQAELEHLRAADEVYGVFRGPRHYVLGNHCLNALAKDEFLARGGARVKKSFYSFDCGGFHFVVLDANFRRDGTPYAAGNFSWTDTWIPRPEQQWLADDLHQAAARRSFVFVHQNLDDETDPHGVKNAPVVRRILEEAGNVVAVFQGHKHSGGYVQIGGVHYVTLRAMVEGPTVKNNAYAIVTLDASGRPRIEGFGRQDDGKFE